MDSKAFIKYISALLLFGLNGIVASNILFNSYEIVFLRTLLGSVLLIVLFLIGICIIGSAMIGELIKPKKA